MTSTTRPARDRYRALLRRPGYPRFVVTVSLSRMATTMFITTGVLLVLARTHSAALAGATAAAGTLTTALSAPFLGAWLDVAARRRVLIVVDQLISVAALIGMVLLAGHAPGWTLVADAVALSVTRPFSTGGFFAAVSEIAGGELLDQASSIEATSLNLSFVVGPALGGALAGAIGPAGAIEIQSAMTAAVAILIALNPVFELRPQERPRRAAHAMRLGLRALVGSQVLRRTGAASALAIFGWGLMTVGFPLYASHVLHAGAHAGGYLWAGLALGSIIGTFAFPGRPSLRRAGVSYLALGISALLWPLAAVLWLGIAFVTLTGILEGPAYSGTIALRQRHTPAPLRSAVMNTLGAFTYTASSLGAVLAGLIARPGVLVLIFVGANLLAALIAGAWPGLGRRPAMRDTP